MQKIISILLPLSILACSSTPQDPNPPRSYIGPVNPYNNRSVTIHWRKVTSPDQYCRQVNRGMSQRHPADKEIFLGCAHWNTTKSECTIVTGLKDNLDTIGHEVKHCFDGDWHR
jgi:hypothetical protein